MKPTLNVLLLFLSITSITSKCNKKKSLISYNTTQEFNVKNEPVKDDPFFGEKVGDIDQYLDMLEQKETNSTSAYFINTSPKRGYVGTIENSKRYVNYAAVAYCPNSSLESWSCKACKNIEANIKLIKIMENKSYQSRAVVMVDEEDRKVILSFRGTNNFRNWIENIKFDKTKFENDVPKSYVHLGFKSVVDSLKAQFLATIKDTLAKDEYKDFDVLVVGHSLGGACAQLATLYLNIYLNLSFTRLQIYTYGQPRVGNRVFTDWFNRFPILFSRVVNYDDVVPHVPPAFMDFKHGLQELFIDRNKDTICDMKFNEDPKCSNRLVPFLRVTSHLKYWGVPLGAAGC